MSVSSISSSASTVDFDELRKKMAERIAERMMKDLDGDGDGALSKSELQKASQAVTSTSPEDSSDASLDDLFAALDTDSDGSISKSELSAFMEKAGPAGPPPGPPPMGGPPPGPPPEGDSTGEDEDARVSANETSTDAAGNTDAATSTQQRMAVAYQQLLAALKRLDGVASDASATGVTA